MIHQHQAIKPNIKVLAFFVGGILLLMAALLLIVKKTAAEEISYDPYADNVAGTAALVSDANNATGAPNGTNASLAGVGASLTLDMGKGEEGTQSLKLYLGQISAQANITVQFLDTNQSVIRSESRSLGASLDASTQNFAYNWTTHTKAYRFVRVAAPLGAGVNVDAVEALGYIGSTPSQDTDGDGVPDRQEQQNGTDPLVPNPAGSNNQNPPRTSQPGGSSSSASEQVNAPPAAGNDKDGDGMADDWESAHDLNPSDKTDAGKDPDHDDLTNLIEYQIGSDPQKYDTDGDGMPDGWEYKHGLDVNKNDADGDPDGDFLTNLGEYRHNTDPNKADDLYGIFGKECTTTAGGLTLLDWLLIGLLVLGAVLAFVFATKKQAKKEPKAEA